VTAATALVAPTLRRRLACFVYEGVLLFGVVMVAGFAYATVTQQRHALSGTAGLQAVVFGVLGVYFAGFWSRTGQTLAMQTWHIRLVTESGGRVPLTRALGRYLLCWMWFLPALLGLYVAGLRQGASVFVVLTVGVLAYASLAWLRADRQYWHDVICRTRLVTTPARVRP
jgi:uncharacterized RDD family membrane protein YckC